MTAPDVIVIGGGVIGSAIAWRLAQRGRSVCLIDASPIGGEATPASAGMLAPGGEILARTPWADLALESVRLYPGFIHELETESGVDVDFRTTGGIDVAFDDAEQSELEERRLAQSPLGIRSAWLDRRVLEDLAPGCPGAGGVYYPADAVIDPARLLGALIQAGARRGVERLTGKRVLRIRLRPAAVEVEIEASRETAAAAVLAAGAWSGSIPIEGTRIPPSFPVKGLLSGYDLDRGSLPVVLRHGHTYLLQRSSGFTLAGSTLERAGFETRVDPGQAAELAQRAERLWPPLGSHQCSRSWTGLRPATDALEPEIRRVAGSNLWIAYGHYRNGILLAPVTAARIAAEAAVV